MHRLFLHCSNIQKAAQSSVHHRQRSPCQLFVRSHQAQAVVPQQTPFVPKRRSRRASCISHSPLRYNSLCPPEPRLLWHGISSRSMMARSSAPSDETPFDKAVTFIITVGYERSLATAMVQALQDAGLSGEGLLATARQMAGRWEVGEDQGLEALAATIKAEQAQKEGKAMVHVWVVPPSAWESSQVAADDTTDDSDSEEETDIGDADMSRAFLVTAVEGTSLADVAKFGIGEGASTLGEYMECACSGIMACSTCHVIVEPGKWFDRVGPPSEAEQDMIDLAYGPCASSRLGCQLVLTEDLDGLIVRLPADSNNLMDDIPFRD